MLAPRLLALAGLSLASCLVPELTSGGRPCSEKSPCGPAAVCHPVAHVCVASLPVDAASDSAAPPDDRVDHPRLDSRSLEASGTAEGAPEVDTDGDGILDSQDNCAKLKNPDQEDLDQDKIGDVCDDDLDGDTVPNAFDPRPSQPDQVLYFSPSLGAASNFIVGGGNWSSSGGELCQTATGNTMPYIAVAPQPTINAAHYLVEARLTATPGPAGGSVGVAFRVMDPYAMGIVSTYSCLVDLGTQRLLLGRNLKGTWSVMKNVPLPSVPTLIVLRATAQSNQLLCEERTTGTKISESDGNIPNGMVGLYTFGASACYQSLVVVTP